MGLTSEDRKYILKEHLRNISHISDKEYQKRIWIKGEGPEVDDFDETCCNFFGDGDPILENYKEFGLTEVQYHLLKKFRDEFRAFSDENYWPPKFIDTPEWSRIVNLAKEVLKAFNYQKPILLILYRTFMPETQCRQLIHKAGVKTFPRPKNIPEDFRVGISNDGVGMKYMHPKHTYISVRVMPGKPCRPFPYQQKPYIVHMKGGETLDKFGNRVPSKTPEMYISLEEFIYREVKIELTDKVKENILNFVMSLIYDISDKEYQRKVWICGEGPEIDDFDENVNRFFDECDSINIENYKDFGLTDRHHKILLNFRNVYYIFCSNFLNYGDSILENYKDFKLTNSQYQTAFIDTPEWEKITRMAKEVLKTFNYPKNP